MKKKILLMAIIILISVSIMMFYIEHHDEEIRNSYNLSDAVEEDILKSPEKIFDNSEKVLLDELLKTGKWVEINPPNDYNEWDKLEERFDHWNVKNNDGIWVSKYNAQAIQNVDGCNFGKLTVQDGFLLNINTLEWGGALYFYPDGDRTKKYKIIDGYIWDTYKMNDKVFALATYPFKIPANGKILEIEKKFGKWKAKEITDIGDIPGHYTFIDKNTMILVTYSKLLKLNNNKIVEIIVDDAFWHGLCPSTVAYENGFVYIGIRAGIAKVNMTNKEVKLLTPKDTIMYP
ncbi:MAG: hypothetical protein PHI90_09495 [Clostridia bacterium]|nr:hypothetical protein [Clostridia bacterium]MDD4049032.1 hypothetical protein [Clostridia bacterium]